jgi:hypothetical protein
MPERGLLKEQDFLAGGVPPDGEGSGNGQKYLCWEQSIRLSEHWLPISLPCIVNCDFFFFDGFLLPCCAFFSKEQVLKKTLYVATTITTDAFSSNAMS